MLHYFCRTYIYIYVYVCVCVCVCVPLYATQFIKTATWKPSHLYCRNRYYWIPPTALLETVERSDIYGTIIYNIADAIESRRCVGQFGWKKNCYQVTAVVKTSNISHCSVGNFTKSRPLGTRIFLTALSGYRRLIWKFNFAHRSRFFVVQEKSVVFSCGFELKDKTVTTFWKRSCS